jgi:uncharacterized membrane protein SpoIIM required for sporulation
MSVNHTANPFSKRSEEWEQLRKLIEKVKAGGLAALNEQQLWELPSLYRKTLSDLSLARTKAGNPALIQELEQLCNSAHAVIYAGTLRRESSGLLHYIARELPMAVRRRYGYVLASAAIMLFFAAVGYVHCLLSPTIVETVLGPKLLGGIHSSIAAARSDADLKLAAQIEEGERVSAWLMITINNISVSVRAFIFGIAGALPTQIILAVNGYLLGAVAYVYVNTDPGVKVNLPLYFVAGIAPHGFIELSAICISAAAGMLLGLSWIFPGAKPRGQALRDVVPDAMRMALACALTLLVAGMIEGFVTPLKAPAGMGQDMWFWLKIACGSVVFALWFGWLYLGGRRRMQSTSIAGK